MRKLLGYRLKKRYKDLEKAVSLIAYQSNRSLEGSKDCQIFTGGIGEERLIHSGVMHWFEEVYEEEKKFTGWAKDNEDPLWIGYFCNGEMKYGVDGFGNWIENDDHPVEYDTKDGDRPATTEEIQQALIKEAKERGFKEGAQIIPVGYSKPQFILGSENFTFSENFNKINTSSPRDSWINCSNPPVFKDGTWAEILPSDPEFKIGDLVVTEKGCYASSNTVKKIKSIEGYKIYIESGGFWRKEHTRHATEKEKNQYYNETLNGKTAIIDGVEWISVNDKLPKEREDNQHLDRYYVKTKKYGRFECMFYKGYFYSNYACRIENVTHWIKLPN